VLPLAGARGAGRYPQLSALTGSDGQVPRRPDTRQAGASRPGAGGRPSLRGRPGPAGGRART
jgi:hypothetical protein